MKIKLLGLNSKKYIEKQIQICAAAGKLSRMPGTVFDAVASMEDYDKALKFIKRVIGMGHTSTIDHDYMVFALSGVSPLVEQTIIEERFSSFTIKSRREVDFSNVGFIIPDFHDENGNLLENNQKLKNKYKKHMKSLFANYQKLVNASIPIEDARFVLPYSFHSEIIMGLDGTSLARMIINLTKGKNSKITELKELGDKLYEIAKVRAPYVIELIEKEEYKDTEIENILNDYVKPRKYELIKVPKLLSHTENIDKTLITNAISRIYALSYEDSEKIYNNTISKDEKLMSGLMKTICNDRVHEDLKQINMRFEFSIPFSILTHITRHRRNSLSIPEFVPNVDLIKYIIPPSIEKSELKTFYDEIFLTNKKIYDEFKKEKIREEDLVYFTLGGNAINIIVNFDGEALRWFLRLRECTKAQWCIRNIAVNMHNEISKVSKYYSANLGPDCVTKHICGEGKESCGRINAILTALDKETK